MAEEVAPMPATVPLSMIMELAVVEGPVALIKKPLVKEPDSLLLKVKKSAEANWPVLRMEAWGRLITRALVLVVMLKMLPKVPVATLEIMLLTTMLVLDCRFLEASVVTRELAVRVAMLILLPLVICKARMPVEEAILNKSRLGRVVVPCTTKVARLVVVPMAIEPLGLTVNRDMPVAVFTWKGLSVPVPWARKETVEEVAPIPATVPLSIKAPWAKAVALVHLATKPLLPEPVMVPPPVAQ